MSFRYALPVVLAIAALPTSDARASVTAWDEVVVRVYDTSGQSAAARRASLHVAASIVSAASIDVIWRVCDRNPAGHRSKGKGERTDWCDSPIRSGEFALRIIRSVVQGSYEGDLALGDALIDTRTGVGVLATIYFDRVEWVATQTGALRSTVLGRAIAHELGHLLLTTNGHGVVGLMRPVWNRDELRHSRAQDWSFVPAEVAAIRDRTLRRTTGTVWGTQ